MRITLKLVKEFQNFRFKPVFYFNFFCRLFVEKFPKHPEYKPLTAEEKKLYSVVGQLFLNKKPISKLSSVFPSRHNLPQYSISLQNLKDSFKKAESLKQKLLKVYQAEYDKNKQNQKVFSLNSFENPSINGHVFCITWLLVFQR